MKRKQKKGRSRMPRATRPHAKPIGGPDMPQHKGNATLTPTANFGKGIRRRSISSWRHTTPTRRRTHQHGALTIACIRRPICFRCCRTRNGTT